MNPKRRFGGLALGVVAGAILIFGSGCSIANTQPDQVGLHYNGGPLASTEFLNCVEPSTRNVDNVADIHYYYPQGQRTFDFTGAEGAESGVLTVVSADNQELEISGVLTFNLDTSCEGEGDDAGGMLRQFHENIGLKYRAYMDDDGTTSDGWDEMLRTYMGQPLQKTLAAVAQQYDWLALYNDPETRVAFETAVSEGLSAAIVETIGAEDGVSYFENFSLTLQKPKPNQDLVDALAAVQVALTQHDAIEQQNQNIADAAIGLQTLVDTFGPEGAVAYEVYMACINGESAEGTVPAGCPEFLIVPQGTNLNVPVPE